MKSIYFEIFIFMVLGQKSQKLSIFKYLKNKQSSKIFFSKKLQIFNNLFMRPFIITKFIVLKIIKYFFQKKWVPKVSKKIKNGHVQNRFGQGRLELKK